jgi:hypothetical protein
MEPLLVRMRFYAVRTEAIHRTHQALQRLGRERGGSAGPSRALRVAQLYGHLQCHADGAGGLQLRLRELAESWHLQPSQLRTDLGDLQAMGWLRYRGQADGTRIQLLQHARADDLKPEHLRPPGPEAPQPTGAAPSLIHQFAGHYNRHRPASWPPYEPRSQSLSSRLRRAIQHAGGPEPFWQLLRQALSAMPPFWRDTYPQGRSGADCVAALLSTGRQGMGLGVEFWHVFCWSATSAPAANTTAPASEPDQTLSEALTLLAWDGHHWRGQGIAAAALSRRDKLRYGLALEAAGHGEAGAAQQQYGEAATGATITTGADRPWG